MGLILSSSGFISSSFSSGLHSLILHDPGLLLDLSLDLSLDLGAKLGNPLLNVDGAGAAGHALHQAGGGAGPSSGHRHN